MQLSRDTDDNDSRVSLPSSLINTYFHLFEMTCKKSEAANSKVKNKQPKNSSSAMKSRLLSALLTGVNRAHPYLPLKDAGMERHIDALYRISHTAPPAAATQALMLLFQLAIGSGDTDNPQTSRRDRFYRALYSKLSDPGMFGGRQLTLFFNLLYKAMKYDNSVERVAAFAKRLLHTVLHLPSSIICGTIFLISEISSHHPELNEGPQGQVKFDPSKREPQAAFDGKLSLQNELWELSLLAHHFHPSITKFTSSSDGKILYKGDPLKDFTLAPFLDKFAFRNPKSLDKQMKRGESIAERKSGLTTSTALPMNDPSYLESKSIQVEDNFFHQFFVERAKRDEQKGIVRGSGNDDKNDSDMEDEALDEAEADEHEQGLDFAEGDTDSEEEAFVNQLAENLMARSGHGQVDFDDEDPDMEGWSDFDDSDNEDGVAIRGEDDDFMDGDSSGSDGEGNSALPVFNMDEEFSDDDGVHLDGEYSTDDDDDDDDDSQSGAAGSSVFADADEFDEEKEVERRKKRKRHR